MPCAKPKCIYISKNACGLFSLNVPAVCWNDVSPRIRAYLTDPITQENGFRSCVQSCAHSRPQMSWTTAALVEASRCPTTSRLMNTSLRPPTASRRAKKLHLHYMKSSQWGGVRKFEKVSEETFSFVVRSFSGPYHFGSFVFLQPIPGSGKAFG